MTKHSTATVPVVGNNFTGYSLAERVVPNQPTITCWWLIAMTSKLVLSSHLSPSLSCFNPTF